MFEGGTKCSLSIVLKEVQFGRKESSEQKKKYFDNVKGATFIRL